MGYDESVILAGKLQANAEEADKTTLFLHRCETLLGQSGAPQRGLGRAIHL